MNKVPELLISGQTDVGRMREHNEDNIAWDSGLGLAMLADGMGGHNAGEVASAIAVDVIRSSVGDLLQPPRKGRRRIDIPSLVRDAIGSANSAILEHAKSQPQCAGMGTTVALVLFHGNSVTLGHVGDSRIYRLRGDELQQMTTDHSLVQELVENGFLTHEEARASANKNLITRALGIDAAVEVDILNESFEPGDLFLLCSDGLSDLVPDDEIQSLLNAHIGNTELDKAANALVETANKKGGMDNISVILIRVR